MISRLITFDTGLITSDHSLASVCHTIQLTVARILYYGILMMTTTKQGKHGTLHLFSVSYHDEIDQGFGTDVSRVWAYNREHAEEKFLESAYGQGFDSFKIDSIAKVRQ